MQRDRDLVVAIQGLVPLLAGWVVIGVSLWSLVSAFSSPGLAVADVLFALLGSLAGLGLISLSRVGVRRYTP